MALVMVLAHALRSGLPHQREVVGVLLLLPQVLTPARSRNERPLIGRAGPEPPRSPPRPLPPVPLPAPAAEAQSSASAIEWDKEARRAAEAAVAPSPYLEFGKVPKGNINLGPGGPRHRKGEQYHTAPGEWVVWVSDRCFMVSDYAVPLVTDLYPGVLKPARTVCEPGPRPPPYVPYYWRDWRD